MSQLKGKSVLVLGLGETGLSLVRWLTQQKAKVRVADSRNVPPGMDVMKRDFAKVEMHTGFFRSELLEGIELVAISPGVPVRETIVQKALERKIPVVGDIELFAQALPQSKRPKIIAITGSNGKTTVTSMVGAMCREAGLDTVVAGNISPAVLDVLVARKGKQPDVWVLELSSFQLETTYTLNPDAATVLNISEDHMDRYDDMGDYIAAKARIFRADGEGGVQVLNRDDTETAAMALRDRRHSMFSVSGNPVAEGDWGIEVDGASVWLAHGSQRVMKAAELQVQGMHNVANALAALALCRAIDLPLPALVSALKKFKGLPHRVEVVDEINDVVYYDDSKGTNVGATVAALVGLGRKAVAILGGDGKGQDFTPLEPAVTQHARAVVLIGRDAEKIAEALEKCDVPKLYAKDMQEAVQLAAAEAQAGDAVLMSPACASFDMYRNYVHRAEVFIAAVHALKEGK